MESIMRDVDDFLADKVASDGSSSALWGANVDTAVHWLNVASNNNLTRLAAKAERFLVQAAAHLSGSHEAEHIPPSLLLHMLDTRHAAITSLLEVGRACGLVCQDANMVCSYGNAHRVAFRYDVRNALAALRALEPRYPSVELD
ncbi:g4667 [Coccomyxa elongata]